MKASLLLVLLLVAVPAAAQTASQVAVSSPSAVNPGPGLTFAECYRRTVAFSLPLANTREVVNESVARYRRALGTVLPNVGFAYSYTRQGLTPGSGIPSYIASENSTEGVFTLTQSLFAGLKEYNALIGSRYERRQRELESLRLRQTILSQVADAYFTLAEQRETIKVLEGIREVYQARLSDLARRERIGRSRPSESSLTRVINAQNEAQLEQARGQEAIAVKQLHYLTGIAEIGDLDDPQPVILPAGDRQRSVARASSRADVAAAQNAALVAGQEVRIARAGFWPTVKLNANYFTVRTGQLTGIDWAATITATIPILPQVDTIGSVEEAAARQREAENLYSLAKLDAQQEIENAYDDYQAGLAQLAAFERAMAAAEENARLTRADYQLNLISNLDVLTTLQALQNSRRDYLHAAYEAKRRYWRLQAAIGAIPF